MTTIQSISDKQNQVQPPDFFSSRIHFLVNSLFFPIVNYCNFCFILTLKRCKLRLKKRFLLPWNRPKNRPKSQKWCHGGFKRVREMLVSVCDAKSVKFFLLSIFIVPSTSPEIVSLHPPSHISCTLLPSMKNASFICGLGLACLELIESTPLKYVIKWWTKMGTRGTVPHVTGSAFLRCSLEFGLSVGLKL